MNRMKQRAQQPLQILVDPAAAKDNRRSASTHSNYPAATHQQKPTSTLAQVRVSNDENAVTHIFISYWQLGFAIEPELSYEPIEDTDCKINNDSRK